jgi:hypothetical protein
VSLDPCDLLSVERLTFPFVVFSTEGDKGDRRLFFPFSEISLDLDKATPAFLIDPGVGRQVSDFDQFVVETGTVSVEGLPFSLQNLVVAHPNNT